MSCLLRGVFLSILWSSKSWGCLCSVGFVVLMKSLLGFVLLLGLRCEFFGATLLN
jgi:hypothetical protein